MSGLPRPVTYEDSQSEQYVANQMSDVQLPNKLSKIPSASAEEPEEVKNGSYHPTDNHSIEDHMKSEDEEQINDTKLSIECMQSGQLPFGQFYEDLQFVKLSKYPHGIPTGLEGMKRRLIEQNGLTFEGIFRLRGKELNLNLAKEQLNALKPISIINCSPIEVAQLMKAFYRLLPCDEPGYLPESLLNASSDEEILYEFERLSEPRKSLLLWTFDLWIKIEEYKPMNKMTLQSMSIVFSPNMVRCLNPNPMVFLEQQKKVQRVIHDAAKLRKNGQLIINGNQVIDDQYIVPFRKDRSSTNADANSEGPKYAAVQTTNNNNRNNNNNRGGFAAFFANCVLL